MATAPSRPKKSAASQPAGGTPPIFAGALSTKERLKRQRIETPSWGYANCGTRFGTFVRPEAARTLTDKLEDAALVHRLTGVCPTVALHIPWDQCDDWVKAKQQAKDLDIAIGAINPNVFQDQDYAYGSVTSPEPAVRSRAVAHMIEYTEIMRATGSPILSLWFADGSNYPGQQDLRTMKRRMQEALAAVYAKLPTGGRMLVEYKCFEPAFYATALPDWGTSYLMCQKLGPQAQVLVDTGHHLPGCNIEQIVAVLLDEGRLGGFHLNGRKYADDDLTVGSINPYELFLIYNELAAAEESDDRTARTCAAEVAYMFDQAPALKNRIEATIQSVMTVQEMYAKALLVDHAALARAQDAHDVVGAEEILRDAYNTDVRPLLAEVRQEMCLEPDPLKAYRAGGYEKKAAAERTKRSGVAAAGGGFQ